MLQAAVSGLQNQPTINAVIDGDDIIYKDYIDISIAVGTPKVDNILLYFSLIYFYFLCYMFRTNLQNQISRGPLWHFL